MTDAPLPPPPNTPSSLDPPARRRETSAIAGMYPPPSCPVTSHPGDPREEKKLDPHHDRGERAPPHRPQLLPDPLSSRPPPSVVFGVPSGAPGPRPRASPPTGARVRQSGGARRGCSAPSSHLKFAAQRPHRGVGRAAARRRVPARTQPGAGSHPRHLPEPPANFGPQAPLGSGTRTQGHQPLPPGPRRAPSAPGAPRGSRRGREGAGREAGRREGRCSGRGARAAARSAEATRRRPPASGRPRAGPGPSDVQRSAGRLPESRPGQHAPSAQPPPSPLSPPSRPRLSARLPSWSPRSAALGMHSPRSAPASWGQVLPPEVRVPADPGPLASLPQAPTCHVKAPRSAAAGPHAPRARSCASPWRSECAVALGPLVPLRARDCTRLAASTS